MPIPRRAHGNARKSKSHEPCAIASLHCAGNGRECQRADSMRQPELTSGFAARSTRMRMLVRTDRGLWAVADGMGGHDAGDVASAMVIEALSRTSDRSWPRRARSRARSAALEDVNRAARSKWADAGPTVATIGSTVVGLASPTVTSSRCFWAGDSRAYRVRDGVRSSSSRRDHSLVQDLVDAGMIERRGGRDSPQCQHHHPRGRGGRAAAGRYGQR